ncbi:hypothetical protein T09_2744 [Trichinella sp. T9]|nr:hypothetical protein T09_2744 [Trichinella sp. T9]
MVAVASDVVSFGGVCAHLFVARGVLNHSDCWQHDLINATIHIAFVFFFYAECFRHKITTDCNDRCDSTETESDAPARYVFEMNVVRQPSEERWVAERHKAARRCRNEWQRQRQQAWRNGGKDVNKGSSTCCTCNGPLPRAGSFAFSTGLLTRPSLFGDGPVLTGAFPFRSVSRFPDGIATTKQQAISIYFIRQSETRIDDDVNTNTLLATCQH